MYPTVITQAIPGYPGLKGSTLPMVTKRPAACSLHQPQPGAFAAPGRALRGPTLGASDAVRCAMKPSVER